MNKFSLRKKLSISTRTTLLRWKWRRHTAQIRKLFNRELAHDLTQSAAYTGANIGLASKLSGKRKYADAETSLADANADLLHLRNSLKNPSGGIGLRRKRHTYKHITMVIRRLASSKLNKKRKIKLSLNLDKTTRDQTIQVDIESVRRIVQNLIDNAVRATTRTQTIFVAVAINAENLIVRVRDNGRGMTPEESAKVFSRTRVTTKTDSENHGHGTQSIFSRLDAHYGNLSYKSNIGKGTSVTITIPRKPITAAAKQGRHIKKQ
jgi:signal transduction histidine kinase